MNRAALRWLGVAAAAAALSALVAQSPRLLRRLEYFAVDQVEVTGTRYLAPEAALSISGIAAPANVFDDPEPWRQALLAHPLVADARIERRLPGTIILRITETEPVALARTPELMPVDATGQVLPIDPAAQSIDLPVLNVASAVGDDGRLAEPAAISMLAAYERIRRFEPALAARVSEILPAHGGGLRLLLSDPPLAEVLLPADFGAIGLRQVQLALSDLGARDELPRVRRIDVRFRDQVVVSLSQRPNR